MKLVLKQEEQCSILEVQGDIDAHSINVLKAGLTKLLQNGKNRIILHIQPGTDLSTDAIRELSILDVYARELSGRILLVSADQGIETKVKSFAVPPVVTILPTVEKAVETLRSKASEGEEAGEVVPGLKAEIEARDRRISALEAKLKQTSPEEAQKLRTENASLQDKLKLLEGQVADLASRRKVPGHPEGMAEKIEALEDAVKKLGGEKIADPKAATGAKA